MENLQIRPIAKSDQSFLWEMLYLAIYVPAGQPPLSRDILEHPEVKIYAEKWGRPGDLGFIAVQQEKPVAAAWLRLWPGPQMGYGYIDDDIPELSMATLPEFRSRGIGLRLLQHILLNAQGQYPGVSISVTTENPARRLYERNGFKKVKEVGNSWLMAFKWEGAD